MKCTPLLLAGLACASLLVTYSHAHSPQARPTPPAASRASTANLALGAHASQSSLAFAGAPGRAVDGNADGDYMKASVTHTALEQGAWWLVDLDGRNRIDRIVVWNRTDCCAERLADFTVTVSEEPLGDGPAPAGAWTTRVTRAARMTELAVGRPGRYVRVQLTGREHLSLAEVEVFGVRGPGESVGDAVVPGIDATDTVSMRLQPSASPQTVSYGNLVRVTVPGGLLRSPETLTIAPVRSVPRAAFVATSVPAYEISLGALSELPVPLAIDFEYEPNLGQASTARPPELLALRFDRERASFQPLPTTVDVQGRRAAFTTTHLSSFLLARAPVFQPYDARLIQDDALGRLARALMGPTEPGLQPDFDTVLVTSNFVHTYRRAEVAALSRTFVAPEVWPGKGIPKLPEVVAQSLEEALVKYGWLVTKAPVPLTRPLSVTYVRRTGLFSGEPAPAAYEHGLDRIEVDTSASAVKNEPSRYRNRSAHELFHALQNRWLGGRRRGGAKCAEPTLRRPLSFPHGYWWVEASAEVAACRLAFDMADRMGKSPDDIYPYLLDYALSREGLPENTHEIPGFDGIWFGGNKLEYHRGALRVLPAGSRRGLLDHERAGALPLPRSRRRPRGLRAVEPVPAQLACRQEPPRSLSPVRCLVPLERRQPARQ